MAKRKASLRRSGQFSRNRSSLLYNSAVLNPNSSILDEDRTFWWNDLEENTPLRHSLIHNTGNETSRQLNPNSEMEASHNLSQWWKNLSTNESNSSSSKEDLKKINKVTVRVRPHTIASTTSESENEVSITKKKRINLRPARKKTEENVFLNVLNSAKKNTVTESIKLKSKLQKQHSDFSINELLEIKLHKNTEDSPVVSSNSKRLRSNIFKKKRGNQVEDHAQNIFQDALTNDKSKLSNSLSKVTKLSTQSESENVNIGNIGNESIENSATLSLNTRSLRSNVFKRKRGNKIKDRTPNIFQDALKEDRSRISDSTSKVPKTSTQPASKNVDSEDVDDKNMENSVTLSSNSRRLRSNIFKSKKDNQIEDHAQNIFQDALTKDGSNLSNSVSRITKLSTQSANDDVDIEDDNNKSTENSATLSLNTRRSNVFKKERSNKMEDRTQKNTFQDALKEDRSRISDFTSKVPKTSTQPASKNVDSEDVDDENMENSATLSSNLRRLRSNIFKSKKDNQVEDHAQNIFQDALTKDKSKLSNSLSKVTKLSTQSANEDVDIEDDNNKSTENSATLSLNTRSLRSNVFKKKRGNKMEDRTQRNTFQDALKEDKSRISDSTNKIPKISTQSANNVNIEDVDNENMENSATLSLNTRTLRSNVFRNKRGSQVEALAQNIFQDALTEDRSSQMSDSTNRISNVSTQFANENVDIEDVGNKNMENSPNLSLNTRITSRSNVFKNKRGNQVEDDARNIFQDALAKDRSKMLDSTKSTLQSRITRLSTQSANEDVDIEDDNNKSRENSSDLSLNTRRLRSNVFMKKGGNKMEDRINTPNIFPDALTEDRSRMSDSTNRISNVSTQFANENVDIEDVGNENMENSPNLSLNTRITSRSNVFKNKRGNQVEDDARNIFQDALAKDRSKMLDSTKSTLQSRITRLSTQSANEDVDIEDDNNKSRENSSDLSLNTRRLRSNVFMKKRGNKMEDRINTQNIFPDALAEDRSKMSRSTSRTANVSAQFANENKRGSQAEDRAQNISKDAEDKSEISDSMRSRATKLSAQSENRIVHIEDVDNTSMPFEIDVGSLPIVSSKRVSSTENTTLFFNTTDKNVPAPETVQQNYPSPDNRRRPAVSADVSQNSFKGNKKMLGRQKSLNRSSQSYKTSIKPLNKDVSIDNTKLNSSKKLKTIDDFFKIKPSSTAEPSNTKNLASSPAFNEKMEKIKMELKKSKQTKEHEVVATNKKKYDLKVRSGANPAHIAGKQRVRKNVLEKPTKMVDKAFLVNGKVYKVAKLPRPKYWVTDRLYKFLWKNMEEKYKFSTRVKSEKFIQELAKMVSFICKRKKYDSYKMELKTLMKEMARLNIIKTRDDFYHFCWDYMPYEFRVKVVPMLLPNNKRTIPYNPEMLYTPILDDDDDDDDDGDDD